MLLSLGHDLKSQFPPTDVDLVLLDGGINDVDLLNILDPSSDDRETDGELIRDPSRVRLRPVRGSVACHPGGPIVTRGQNATVVPNTFRKPRASIVAMINGPPFHFLSGELPPDAAVLSNPDRVARCALTRAANVRPEIFVARR